MHLSASLCRVSGNWYAQSGFAVTVGYRMVYACVLVWNLAGVQSIRGDDAPQPASVPDYVGLRREGERLVAEKSYELAHEVYLEASEMELGESERFWVRFRVADTRWRSIASSANTLPSELAELRTALEGIIRELEEAEGSPPELWSDLHESLGDSWWIPRRTRNWAQAWQHYERSLGWWAGSKTVERARQRYLDIVWKAAGAPESGIRYYYGSYGNQLPIEVLENVLKIADLDEDRARAHYLIAMTLRNRRGGNANGVRVSEEFEAAVGIGAKTEWYDDALFHYANWASRFGTAYYDDNGDLRLEPDYGKAIELFEQLLKQFQKGETRYYDGARNAIKNITDPQITLSVANIYLPGSQVQIRMNRRNIEGVNVDIIPIELNRNVRFKDARSGPWQWLDAIEVGETSPLYTIDRNDSPKRAHYPVDSEIKLEMEIPVGAYLVQATGGGRSARDLLLVSDVSLVLKTSGRRTLGFFNDAISGAPVAEAEIVVWEHIYEKGKWHWEKNSATTDTDGLILFDQINTRQNRQIFASAISGERQAFAIASGGLGYRGEGREWKVFAYPDRTAYRPEERVFWKIVARTQLDGAYEVPTDAAIRYRIDDPKGVKVDEGVLTLNAFGAAWSDLETGAEWPLGLYRISFSGGESKGSIGSATLFRLEEYKLPEFKVEIELGEGAANAEGPVAYRVGDVVTGTISTEYYFGGSVPDAEVQLTVSQRPFFHWFRPVREFGWFYEDMDRPEWVRYGGRGTRILSESLKTDPNGRASFSFDTPQYSDQDFEYTIEAQVVDASRREIVAARTIRVTRQSHFIYLDPQHRVYQPGDEAEIVIRSVDPNDRPVSVEGRLRLTRERWREVWVDDRGREISGAQMQELRKRSERRFAFGATASDYHLREQGYEIEEIDVTIIRTGADGEAVYRKKVPKEGYYRLAWVSGDKNGQPIKSDTAFWAGGENDVEIGYRPGGVSIIVDKDTFRVGETSPIMITTPAAGRYVLLTVGAEELISYRLVRMEGTVKLLYLEIAEEHVPNSFLDVHMVSNGELFFQQEQIIVPPLENFLNIDVTADAEGYEPGETGRYRIQVSDNSGNPVAAELSLGLVDEAVYYIQPDFAGDIRRFFFGSKRSYGLGMGSTFAQKPYFGFRTDTEGEESDEDRELDTPTAELNENESVRMFSAMSATASADSAAAPTAMEAGADAEMAGKGGADGPGAGSAVVVRTDFRSTVFWQPDIVTGEDGIAEVEVKFPDSLTNWRAVTRGVARENRFGHGSIDRQTRLPLIARLQAPRFFVEGDTVTLSGVFNNNTGLDLPIKADLVLNDRLAAEGYYGENGELLAGNPTDLVVSANSQLRVDWRVVVRRAGEAKIKLIGVNRQFTDAVERSFPVYEHGLEKFVAKSGKVRGDSVTVSVHLPEDRRAESTRMTVRVTPSIAVSMLDALPFLVDYPYGCAEQTLSRFLPAVIVAKTLRDLGLKREEIASRMFGGIEIESVAETHSGNSRGLEKLDAVVGSGLKLLYDSQNHGGGWGWWKGGADDPFMSAYVMWGLNLAVAAQIDVDFRVLRRARNYLEKELVGAESAFDEQAWILHALASRNASGREGRPTRAEAVAFLNLMKNRDQLNPFTRSLLALSGSYFGFDEDARLLVRNLRNGVQVDYRPDSSVVISNAGGGSEHGVIPTAHWGNEGVYWRWSEGGVEATAFALMAMLEIDPANDLVEPVTHWLIKNRRGANWSNTRDSAIAVLALNAYLEASGELDSEVEFEVFVNDASIGQSVVTGPDLLMAPSNFEVENALLLNGLNEIVIERKGGEGHLYFSVHAEYFSLEDPIAPIGNEIFAERAYYRVKSVPTLLKGFVEQKTVLNDGDSLASGDRVEVVIKIEGKNNYEYLIFEDLKPAGFEALQLRSGEPVFARELRASDAMVSDDGDEDVVPVLDRSDRYTGRQRWVYQELRDRKVVCFIDKLPGGIWEIRYRMRAEIPGMFHALPVVGAAMYVPEIRANGSELRFTVIE